MTHHGRILIVHWTNHSVRFHSLWLRDNGQDDNTRDPVNRQKLITLQDISQNTLVTQATINDLNQLCLVFYPDESATTIDLDWLENHIYDKDNDNTKLFDSTVITWDATLVEQLPTGSYKKILANQRDLLEWLKQIEK